MSRPRHYFFVFSFIISLIAIAPLGYIWIEKNNDWSYLDAFYFVIITLTTIGYGEVHPLSMAGKIYTIFVILFGLSLFGYTLSLFLHFILNDYLENYFKSVFSKKKMQEIQELKNHYIICGYGRIGSNISDELSKLSFPLVIIDSNKSLQGSLEKGEKKYIIGEAENDKSLIEAGIKNAKMVIITTGNDYINIYITISARILNPKVYIITSYKQSKNKNKIIVAGANKLIPVYSIVSIKILQHIFNKFLSLGLHYNEYEKTIELDSLKHEAFSLKKTSPLFGKKGFEIEIKLKVEYNLKLIGIIKGNNKYYENCQNINVYEGDKILILGKDQDLEIFKIKHG